MPSIAIACVVVAGILVLPLLSPRGRDTLSFCARSSWELGLLARATDALIEASASTQRVILDIRQLSALDDDTRAALQFVCARWHEVGAIVLLLDGSGATTLQ
jgi:hypothetical protein